MNNKAGAIIAYILLGILLLPILALGLYLIGGIGLFLILYIIDRKKQKKIDEENKKSDKQKHLDEELMRKQMKPYKYASVVCCCIILLILYFTIGVEAFDPFTWQGFGFLQLIAFISMLPMCVFYIIRLKKH